MVQTLEVMAREDSACATGVPLNDNSFVDGAPSASSSRNRWLLLVAALFCVAAFGGYIGLQVFKREPLCVHVQAILHLSGDRSGKFAGIFAEVLSVDNRKDKLATNQKNREEYRKLIVDSVGAWLGLSDAAKKKNTEAFFQVRIASHDLKDEELIAGVASASHHDDAPTIELAVGEGGGAFTELEEFFAKVDDVRLQISPVGLSFLDARPARLAVQEPISVSGSDAPLLRHHVRVSDGRAQNGLFFTQELVKDHRFRTFNLGRRAMEILTCDRRAGDGAGKGAEGLSPQEHGALVQDLIFSRLGRQEGEQAGKQEQRPVLRRMDEHHRAATIVVFDAVLVYTQVYQILSMMARHRVPTVFDFPFQVHLLDHPGSESRIGHRFFLGALLAAEQLGRGSPDLVWRTKKNGTKKGRKEWDPKFMEKLRLVRDYVTNNNTSAASFAGAETMEEAVKRSSLGMHILTGLEQGGVDSICFKSGTEAFGLVADYLSD